MEIFKGNGENLFSCSNQNDESGRGCRIKKRQLNPTCCPVCSVTLRQSEIDSHLSVELEKLNKLPMTKMKINNGKSTTPSSSNGNSSTSSKTTSNTTSSSSSSSSSPSSATDSSNNKPWETFQKVKNNRQNRLRSKTRKRKADDQICPICNREIFDDLALHVELCLRKNEQNNRSENGVDHQQGEDDIDIESYDEYEWAGQRRIRVTTLLEGGVSTLGQSLQNAADDDEDLNVDCDGELYGSPQYSEKDIILPCEEPAENMELRKAVLGVVVVPSSNCTKNGHHHNNLNNSINSNCVVKKLDDPVIEVLKYRIRELEERLESKDEDYKCLICMERYKTPVISVCCWHVHCEICWLQTLGAKKLCPQCNMITSPSDLRKIYI